MRGPIAPPGTPLARTRADSVDEVVLAVVERLSRRLGPELDTITFRVQDVPPAALLQAHADWPLLAAQTSIGPGRTEIVVFRRPVMLRCDGLLDTRRLVLLAVAEQVANLLGLPLAAVDPQLGQTGPDDT